MLAFILRPFVSRFIAGENMEEAFRYAKTLRARKVTPIFDALGEHAQKKAEIVRVMGQYLELLEKMSTGNVKGAIAVKLTALGMDIDPLLCYRATLRIVQRAEDMNCIVWLDMENSPYTTRTLSMYKKLRQQHANVGICIQACLKRSKKDVLALLLDSPRIRLVKGAYGESKEIAFQSHEEIRKNYKALAHLCAEKHAPLAIATHDPVLLRHAMELRVPKNMIEFQLLKGVRGDEERMLVENGFSVKEYCAFGREWKPYVVRRIQEYWRNITWAIQDILHAK